MQNITIEASVGQTVSQFDPKDRGKFGRNMRKYFGFDDDWINLNHGSFGSTPTAISKAFTSFQLASERRPDAFIRYGCRELLYESQRGACALLNAPDGTCVFVPNATTGVNTVLRGLDFGEADAIVYFDFLYGACANTVEYVAETTGAAAVRVELTLPVSKEEVVRRFRDAVVASAGKGKKVKAAVFETVVSMPSFLLPYAELVRECERLGVLSVVDAAHAIGHLPIDLARLDPDFFVSNAHKWLFVPRGAAVLYVAARNRWLLRSTLPTSWGWVSRERAEKMQAAGVAAPGSTSTPEEEWAWRWNFLGTVEAAGYFCVPAAIAFREAMGGEAAIMRYCGEMAEVGARAFAGVLGAGAEVMGGCEGDTCAMRNVRLPLRHEDVEENGKRTRARVVKWLQRAVVREGDAFIALFSYDGGWWARVCGQVYLEEEDFVKGAGVLKGLIERVRRGDWGEEEEEGGGVL